MNSFPATTSTTSSSANTTTPCSLKCKLLKSKYMVTTSYSFNKLHSTKVTLPNFNNNKNRKHRTKPINHNNYEHAQIHHHSCSHADHSSHTLQFKNQLLNSKLNYILTFGHKIEDNPFSLLLSIIGLSLHYMPSSINFNHHLIRLVGTYIVFTCSGFPLLLNSIVQLFQKNIDAHVLMCLAALASIYLGMATEVLNYF